MSNLLKGTLYLKRERERERVSQGEMVGDGTESAICIAVVDAIVLSSLS